jgi:hypothetical protein
MFQTLALFAGDIISDGGVINDVLGVVADAMQSAVGQALSGIACPQLAKFGDSLLSPFPGYTNFNPKTGEY